MSLPKQVQLQAEEAERLEQELLAQNEGREIQPEVEETPQEEPAEAQPVAEEPAPQAEPEAPPPTDREETWEARYRTLQGRWNADVPRLQSEVKGLTSKLQEVMGKLEARQAPPKEIERLVTDTDVEAFGSDLIDVMERKAREVARQELGTEMARLQERNVELEQTLSGVSERQATTDRRSFFADLERLVPDYEALNVDPGFLEWLAEVDTLSGVPRQEYLTHAYGQLDAHRTATLFSTYKQLSTPAPRQTSRNLERQVAPGTSRVSTAVAQNMSERVWSQKEVEKFYRDVQKGGFQGNDAEKVRIEAEIDLAAAEGRIR